MRYFLLIAMQLCCEVSFCQMDTVGNAGSLEGLKIPGYKDVDRIYRSKLIARSVKEDFSSRTVEEYFLKDDSSFYFIAYYKSGYESKKGIIKIDPKRILYDTLQIPDWTKDGNRSKGLMKDTLLPKFVFVKSGDWLETDTNGSISRGNYFNNQKSGVWIKGRNMRNSLWPPFRFGVLESRQYRNGVPLDSNTAYSQLDSIWNFLKGRWLWQGMESVSHVSCYLKKASDSTQLYNFDFKENGKFSGEMSAAKCQDWHYENGIMYICIDNKLRRFQLMYIDEYMMYWRPIDNEF